MSILADKIFVASISCTSFSSRMLDAILEASISECEYPDSADRCIEFHLDYVSGEEDIFDSSNQQMMSYFSLKASVPRPLSLVLTNDSLNDYNTIFITLLKIHQARWWLDLVWRRISVKDQRSTPRIKQVRLWYQVICISSNLLDEEWMSGLLEFGEYVSKLHPS